MKKEIRKVIVGLACMAGAISLQGASVGSCVGCHGNNFEKKALGASHVVKDMSKQDIIKALNGYKDGSYGRAMKGVMSGAVAPLSKQDIKDIADIIKSKKGKSNTNNPKTSKAKYIDLNKDVSNAKRLQKEDLGNKKQITEEELGLRKTTLYKENKIKPDKVNYIKSAPGTSARIERAYFNAPPMIPHDVEAMLPITAKNNQCLGCHMPNVAKSVGATPLPKTHFTDYRPKTKLKNGVLIKDGKKVKNTSDLKLAKAKPSTKLQHSRFNCTQCHARQSNVKTAVGNTFRPDYINDEFKEKSNLIDTINEGVK